MDTVHYYEQKGKEMNTKINTYEKGLDAFNRSDMGHVQKMELVLGKSWLASFFLDFV